MCVCVWACTRMSVWECEGKKTAVSPHKFCFFMSFKLTSSFFLTKSRIAVRSKNMVNNEGLLKFVCY